MSKKDRVRTRHGRSGHPGVRAQRDAQQQEVRRLLTAMRKQHRAGQIQGRAGPFELWLANLWVGAFAAQSVAITGVGEFDPIAVRIAYDRFTRSRPRDNQIGTQEFSSVLEADERRAMADRSFLRVFDGTQTVQSEWREAFLLECEDLMLSEFALLLASLTVMHRMITHAGRISLTAPHFADLFQPLEAADALHALVEKLRDES